MKWKFVTFSGDLLNVDRYGNNNIAYCSPNGSRISAADRQIQMSLIWIPQVRIERIGSNFWPVPSGFPRFKPMWSAGWSASLLCSNSSFSSVSTSWEWVRRTICEATSYALTCWLSRLELDCEVWIMPSLLLDAHPMWLGRFSHKLWNLCLLTPPCLIQTSCHHWKDRTCIHIWLADWGSMELQRNNARISRTSFSISPFLN